MADFVAVLKKALDKHGDETPEKRTRIYDSVRSMLAKKLAEYSPPLATEAISAQKRSLENAITSVEREYAKSVPETDPLAELEHIFSSIDRNKNQPSHTRQPVKAEPAWPAPPAAKAEPYRPAPPPAATPEPYQSAPSPVAKAEPSWQKPTPVQPVAPDLADPALPGMDADQDDDRADVFPNDEEPAAADTFRLRPAERKRSYGGLIAAVVALLVVAGGGYGIWLNKDAFSKMLGLDGSKVVAKTEPVKPAPAKPATDAPAAPAPAAGAEATKFTQRLTPEGGETDPGPAGGQTGIGEGESVAALTTPPSATNAPANPPPAAAAPAAVPAAAAPAATAPAAGAAPAATPPANGTTPAAPANAAATPPAPAGATPTAPAAPAAAASVPVGQKAIFYEERTSTAQLSLIHI